MKQIALDIGLEPAATLRNFVAGPNQAAVDQLQSWLGGEPLSKAPVPCYLWGERGTGKTHLLSALTHAVRKSNGRVGQLDAATLQPVSFEPSWSLVVMDDVQHYSAALQHAAFNWFINAQTHHCRILAAGDLPPADLPLREDLRSRLGWGDVFQLHPLGEAQQRAVLRQSAHDRGLALGDEVMDFLLSRFSRDLGSLMGLLDLLDAYAMQTQRAISIPLIKSMLENS